MGDPHVPDLVDPIEAPALRRFLAWHALASEFMCGIVARGVPMTPTREQRRALMHQMRTENSQAEWLVKRVQELGGEVPEHDEALDELQAELIEICDRSWLEYLAGAQVAMRAYMNPYLRAMGVLFRIDEEYDGFAREVMTPEVAGHFRRALDDLRDELESYPPAERHGALDLAAAAEAEAFEVFRRFIATSYPALADLGVDTAGLEEELRAERDRFWQRLGESIDAVA